MFEYFFIYSPIVVHMILIVFCIDTWLNKRVRVTYLILTYTILLLSVISIYCYIGVLKDDLESLKESGLSRELMHKTDPVEAAINSLLFPSTLLYLFMFFLPLIIWFRFESDKAFHPWKYKRTFEELQESFLGLSTIYYFYNTAKRDTLVILSMMVIAAFTVFSTGMLIQMTIVSCNIISLRHCIISNYTGQTPILVSIAITIVETFTLVYIAIKLLTRIHKPVYTT